MILQAVPPLNARFRVMLKFFDTDKSITKDFFKNPPKLVQLLAAFITEVAHRDIDPETKWVYHVFHRFKQVRKDLKAAFTSEAISSWQPNTILAIVKLALCEEEEINRVIKNDFRYSLNEKGFPNKFMKALNILFEAPACDR
jgi:hypothetical protein